jgi:hypothetical protein
MATRDANAKAQGVTALRVAGPSKESIEKFKEVKARRDEARKKGGGDKRRGEKRPTTATPGGVAAQGSASSSNDTVNDFFAGLVDLSNIAMVATDAIVEP